MNRPAFYNAVRPNFGGKLSAGQVSGLDLLLTTTEGLPLTHRAYILATSYHETRQTMQPVREAFGTSDADAVRRLEAAYKKGQLTWVKTPYWRADKDGKAWFGRGYVQLTHRDNYQRLGARIGVDLVADPSAALSPFIAAKIILVGMVEGLFTGKKLADYLPGDYVGARHIVNGSDCAAAIAGYARFFEAALAKAEATTPSPADAQPPVRPDVEPTPAKPATAAGWWLSALWRIIETLTHKWRA